MAVRSFSIKGGHKPNDTDNQPRIKSFGHFRESGQSFSYGAALCLRLVYARDLTSLV